MSANDESQGNANAILSTFSLTSKNNSEECRFEKLASLKKLLRQELNKSITIDECDAVLLAGALLLNDIDTVKEQSRLINDINIRLWGNAVDPLSKWIQQYSILPQVRNMNKFIEGNTPLHFAVLTGNFENIAFLLSKQADPFLKNAHGDKPLELCQDYHRKLHGKTDKKRKRHKSLKKRSKKKSHKRSKSAKHTTTNSNTKGENNNNNNTERSHSYDNDADDENESDFYYNNNDNDHDDNESTSSGSSTASITSQSPMHLSCREFDQLFSNAVENINNDIDKEGVNNKGNNEKNNNNKIQIHKKNANSNGTKNDGNKKKITNKNNKAKNTNNKSKLKSKSMRKKTHKNNRNNHGKNNRNKNKGRMNGNNYNRRSKHNHSHAHKKHNKNRKNTMNTKIKANNITVKSTRSHHTHSHSLSDLQSNTKDIKPSLHSHEHHLHTHTHTHNHKSDSISISSTESSTHSTSNIILSSSVSSSVTTDDSISISDTISSITNSDNSNISSSDDSISDSNSISTSVTLSDTDSSSNISSVSLSDHAHMANTNSVEINIDRKNGKIIAKSLTVTKNTRMTHSRILTRDSSSDNFESTESSDDEIYITSDQCDESSSIFSHSSSESTTNSSGCSESGSNQGEDDDKDNNAINKLLQQTMEQQTELKEKDGLDRNGEGDNENDLHSQLVPIIIALSEINIFAESASLARIVKFICTLIFFVALHWLEGNSAAKMIVKVGVSIIYLAAMFGHRINEWKECIDAETVLRKQQWTKQRDKERQKRKDRLQKTLRSPDSKRSVAKKQRKLEKEMFYKQDIFDWRSRIRMMINHAESAFLQHKWEMAEIYFSRLLGFLMENETDPHILLNERKRNNLKINRRWKGMFDDHYSIPIAKMFSRRAYCLCKIKHGEYPHGAPPNNATYKTIGGHLELSVMDLAMAIRLREMSPIYQKFMKLYKVDTNGDGHVNNNDVKYICDEKLGRLVTIMSGQLCDLISLAGLYDLKDEFEKAYENTLQADDIIHCLNKFNKQYINVGNKMEIVKSDGNNDKICDNNSNKHESELESKRILATIQSIQRGCLSKKYVKYLCLFDDNGNFKLSLNDIIPLKDIGGLLHKKVSKGKKDNKCKSSKDLNHVDEVKETEGERIKRSKSMISLLQISHSMGESKFYSVDIDDGKIILTDNENNKLELMDDNELETILSYPLRRKIDLSGYKQLKDNNKCSMYIQSIIDQQLKKIRLLRLQAANRQRAVKLKNEREKIKHGKSSDVFQMLTSLDNDKKKPQKKKDKSRSKNNQKEKIEKIKIKTKDKPTKPITKQSNKNNEDKNIKQSVLKSDNSLSSAYPVINGNDCEDEVKIQPNEEINDKSEDKKDKKKDVNTTSEQTKVEEILELKLIKSQIISISNATNPSTPNSTISAETSNSVTLSVCSDAPSSNATSSISTNIASTIMEYGASFSVIKSDKEDDDNDCEETKMSMVIGKDSNNNSNNTTDNTSNASSSTKSPRFNNNNNKTNKNKFGKKKPQRRSQIKLKKLKRKNKNKIAKKKSKKNQSKNRKLSDNISNKPNKKKSLSNDDNDERLSISSEFSKSPSIVPSIDTNADDEDDSFSILSASTSSSKSKNVSNKSNNNHRNNKNANKQSPTKSRSQNFNYLRTRNIPPRQQQQRLHRSPKDNSNSTYYRKKGASQNNNDKIKGNKEKEKEKINAENDATEEEPREHWMWNVNCDFWPNCRNSHHCPFKHPTDKGSVVRRRRTTPKSGDIVGKPINCRFGRDCSRMDCWFWHPGDDETFIHPSSIPTSPQSQHTNNNNSNDTNVMNKSQDESLQLSRDRSLSNHSDPSIITTENSYEMVEDINNNNDNKISEMNNITMDNASNSSAVIITKKPRPNPWQKVTTKTISKSVEIPVLSPTTFNNKQILSGHDSTLNIRANVNVNPAPLTATITVGAIYHNDFNINDFHIGDMIRPPKTNYISSRRIERKCKTPTFVTNMRKKKIKSNLNPNASEFSSSRKHAHAKMSRTAPIRPPMPNHFFDSSKMTPKSVDISPPFDPHSQLHNGGVFSPHNNFDNNMHSNMNNSMKSTTQTTISSTITQTIDHSHRNNHSSPPSIFGNALGTRISPQTQNNSNYYGWGAANSNYNHAPVDEYKQAPNYNSNDRYNNNNNNNNDNGWNYDYGDESKVVETDIRCNTQHTRDIHDRNDRVGNDESKEQKPAPATRPWICPSCSFLNEIGTTGCELCSSVRPNENDKHENDNQDTSKETTPVDMMDFNIEDIMNSKETNNVTPYGNDIDDSTLRNLSFNSLFFGNSNTNVNDNQHKHMIAFNEGDHILYSRKNQNGDIQSLEGVILAIRDSKQTPWPIQIEYDVMDEFGNKQIQNSWVLQEDLTRKIRNAHTDQSYKLESNDDDDYYHVQKYDVEGFVESTANSSELNKRIIDLDDADNIYNNQQQHHQNHHHNNYQYAQYYYHD